MSKLTKFQYYTGGQQLQVTTPLKNQVLEN
jgi:hypothetical protein